MPRDQHKMPSCKNPSRSYKRWLPLKNNKGNYSTTSSLNKGSPSAEVHVSRGKYSTTSSLNKGSPSSEVHVSRGKYSTTSSLNKGSPSAEVHVNQGKYSTTSSLNKGSASAEVYFSRMPKSHTATVKILQSQQTLSLHFHQQWAEHYKGLPPHT